MRKKALLSRRGRQRAAIGPLIALVAVVAGCDVNHDEHATAVTQSSARSDAGTTKSGALGATLCATGETAYFSCAIGDKRVAVCRAGSGAVYRYGTPGKVELSSRAVTFAAQDYSGGGEAQLTARNGDYSYTVYDGTTRTAFGDGGNDPQFASGLVIAKGGTVIARKSCAREATVDAGAEHALPAGRFVEH